MDRDSRSVSEDDSGYVTLQITTTQINSVPDRPSEPMDYLRARSSALAPARFTHSIRGVTHCNTTLEPLHPWLACARRRPPAAFASHAACWPHPLPRRFHRLSRRRTPCPPLSPSILKPRTTGVSVLVHWSSSSLGAQGAGCLRGTS